MIKELNASQETQNATQVLKLEVAFSEMAARNEELDSLYIERNNDKAGKNRDPYARANLTLSYETFFLSMENIQNLDPKNNIQIIIEQLLTLHTSYHALIERRKTLKINN